MIPKGIQLNRNHLSFNYRCVKAGNIVSQSPLSRLEDIRLSSFEETNWKKQEPNPTKAKRQRLHSSLFYFVPADFLALAAWPVGFNSAA